MRCFAFDGESEIREVEVEGKKIQAWAPKREGWIEGAGKGSYLSINAATLEPGQEGLDLREWTEQGWIAYLEIKNDTDESRMGVPYQAGMY